MWDFVDILAEVLRIVTFQPREARMRYRLPEWEERMEPPANEQSLGAELQDVGNLRAKGSDRGKRAGLIRSIRSDRPRCRWP